MEDVPLPLSVECVAAAGQGAEHGRQADKKHSNKKKSFILNRGRRQQAPTNTRQSSGGGKLRSLARHWGLASFHWNRKLAFATTGKTSNRKSKKKTRGKKATYGQGLARGRRGWRGVAVA